MSNKHPGPWDPKRVLETVVDGQYNALIDTGALVTGMSNQQVAQFVLAQDHGDRYDAAVFINEKNEKVFLSKLDNRVAKPLQRCGCPLYRRFTFYDQMHTTGTDVHQAINARAAATLGKGVTFRDHAQACWRM